MSLVINLRIEVDDATLHAFTQTHGYSRLATRKEVRTALRGLIDAYWNDTNDDFERGSEACAHSTEAEGQAA